MRASGAWPLMRLSRHSTRCNNRRKLLRGKALRPYPFFYAHATPPHGAAGPVGIPLGGRGTPPLQRKRTPKKFPPKFPPRPKIGRAVPVTRKASALRRGSGRRQNTPPRARQGPWYAAQNAAQQKTAPQPPHGPIGPWGHPPPPPATKVAPRPSNAPTGPIGVLASWWPSSHHES